MNKLALITEAIKYNYLLRARQDQLVNLTGGKPIEVKLAGRGAGKTWSGSNFVIEAAKKYPHIHLIGRTAADVRDVMINGDSGILACSPRWNKPEHIPSKRLLRWPNGSKALCFSAEKPDALRGPQCYAGWLDEVAAYQYPQETFDNYMMGARLGPFPKTLITTTPRRIPLVKDLINDVTMVEVTKVSTFANVKNLAPSYIAYLMHKYDGTTLGRQELYADLLGDVEGALWRMAIIDHARISNYNEAFISTLKQGRIAIVVDPATTSKKTSDESGIIVGSDIGNGKCYVLEDLSGIYTPNEMAAVVIDAFYRWGANEVVYESNQGGEFVSTVINNLDSTIPVTGVHAKSGKALRAEPVVSAYEQQKVCHVGVFAQLEDEQTTWIPKESDFSPNRLDALVYFVHWAILGQRFIAI